MVRSNYTLSKIEILAEITNFLTQSLFQASIEDDPDRIYQRCKGLKTRMMGLPNGRKKFDDSCNRFDTIHM